MNEAKIQSCGSIKFGRRLSVLFGIFALLLMLSSAGIFFSLPLLGSGLLLLGVFVAIVTFILSFIYRSKQARRFSYIAIVLALFVTLAGTIVLFSNQNFERRCVDALKVISSTSDSFENRLDQLEDRFDNN